MGKLEHESTIRHKSHAHPLVLSSTWEGLAGAKCTCCGEAPGGWAYSCNPCRFFLHLACAKTPELIQHPYHPLHSLVLFVSPAYPEGFFNCDACGLSGTGFSYHCGHCQVDLHVSCASKPLFLGHNSHPHALTLAFNPPYETRGFTCDICGHIGSNHWLYRCGSCEFDAHLGCATSIIAPARQPAAMAGGNQFAQRQPLRVPALYPDVAVGTLLCLPCPQQVPVGYPNGNPVVAEVPPMNNNNNAVTANDIMGAAVLGFVDGAAQQVGQTFAESVIGTFSNDGGGETGA
ncbi:protein VACUOLELESS GAMETOPHYTES-like [Wolffia australiana]